MKLSQMPSLSQQKKLQMAQRFFKRDKMPKVANRDIIPSLSTTLVRKELQNQKIGIFLTLLAADLSWVPVLTTYLYRKKQVS